MSEAIELPKQPLKFWKPEEDEVLMRLRREGKTHVEIAAVIGRSPSAIDGRLDRLGVVRADVSWSETDISTLVEMFKASAGYADIAASLGKSRSSISGQVRRLRKAGRLPPLEKVAPRQKNTFRVPTKRSSPLTRGGRLEYKRKVASGEIKPRAALLPFPKIDDITPPEMRVSLFDLSDEQGRDLHRCHWPYGDGPYTFCGRPASDTYHSYCVQHAMIHFHGVKGALFCEAAE